jgi:putative NIF3 family GTP cyclohydrolase 1 type 2
VFKGVEADLYLTGEMSHHEVLALVAQGRSVILTNHTNTERGFLKDVLKGWLQQELDQEEAGWEVVVSEKDRDPLRVV